MPEIPSDDLRAPNLEAFLTGDMCPFCEASFPLTFLVRGPCPQGGACGLFVRFANPFAKDAGGASEVSLEPWLSAGLVADLSTSDWQWLRAAEPNEYLDASDARAVAFKDLGDDLQLARIVRHDTSGELQDGLAEPLVGLGAYEQRAMLLRGRAGYLYAFGGATAQAEPNPTLTRIDLTHGRRAEIALSESLGPILASASALHEPAAFAIESMDGGASVRIVRIDLESGEVEDLEVHSGAPSRVGTTMRLLPDGRIAISSTDSDKYDTRLLIAAWNGSALVPEHRVDFWGRLAGPIAASSRGITLALYTNPATTVWRPEGMPYEKIKETNATSFDAIFY